MAVSKVLYLLRPRFVAISDSYVRDCLGVRGGEVPDPSHPQRATFCAKRMLTVARGIRELGRTNHSALAELHAFANSLTAPDGHYVELSKLRVLDILLWTDVAIYGRNPHQRWTRWYREEAL